MNRIEMMIDLAIVEENILLFAMNCKSVAAKEIVNKYLEEISQLRDNIDDYRELIENTELHDRLLHNISNMRILSKKISDLYKQSNKYIQ